MTRTYSVLGMTCEHCVGSVRQEFSQIVGVSRAEVDLASGRPTVIGDAGDTAVAAAVANAGYELA